MLRAPLVADPGNDEEDFVYGLNLLLTNHLEDAEKYFAERIPISSSSSQFEHCKRVHATFGLALIALIKALISFEDDEKQVALDRLYQTQKLANTPFNASSSSWGLFSSSSVPVDPLSTKYAEIVNLIAADAGVFIGILQFTSESAVGFLKGTLALRKSHKVYQRAIASAKNAALLSQQQITLPTTKSSATTKVDFVEGDLFFDCVDHAIQIHDSKGFGALIAPYSSIQDRIDAYGLLGSGIFTLSFSMIPPRFQSVIGKAMGFDTQVHKREDGLALLVAAMNKRTCRAPIAALILLTFHSAMLIMARGVRETTEEGAKVEQTTSRVLEECLLHYPNSPMFRFLEGRLLRGKSQIVHALRAFEVAEHCSKGMNALLHITLYERAWCEGLLHRFHKAGELFARVARESRWSPCFYSFLSACFYYEYAYRILVLNQVQQVGSINSAKRALAHALAVFKLVPTAVRAPRRGGQILPPEALACRRANEITVACKQAFAPNGEFPPSFDGVDNATLVNLCMACPFLPSLECSYIWNAMFQSPNKEALIADLQHSKTRKEPAATLYRGYLLRELGRFREATTELEQIACDEAWIVEFAKYERGLCAYELGDSAGALKLWNSIKDTDHPMDSRLKFRLRAVLNRF